MEYLVSSISKQIVFEGASRASVDCQIADVDPRKLQVLASIDPFLSFLSSFN